MIKQVACLLLCITHLSAFARFEDARPSTRSVCTSRCTSGALSDFPPLMERYGQRAEALAARQLQEADPVKKQALAAELAELNDKIDAARNKLCRHICRNNPDA